MKKLFLFLCLSLALASGRAWALPVVQLHETFSSGAVFEGELTFTNDYSQVLDVDGYLTSTGYGSVHINWVWDVSYNWAATFGPNLGGNFLMDGSPTVGFVNFITLTWDFSGAPNLLLVSPGDVLAPQGGNNINYTDPLVSGQFGSVPEAGSTVLMIGLSLFGLIAVRRKFRA